MSSGDPNNAVPAAGREFESLLKRLLGSIADVEADGWDTDWTRLPKRSASALLTDLEADLVSSRTAEDVARRVELLGSALALRRWVAGDTKATEFEMIASQLLEPLSNYRRHLQALSSGGSAT